MEEKNNTKEKNLSMFNVNELMVNTYNKIAKWHNDDASGAGLKNLSIELVEDLAGAAFNHLDVPYKGIRVQMDEETKKRVDAEKEKLNSAMGLSMPTDDGKQ